MAVVNVGLHWKSNTIRHCDHICRILFKRGRQIKQRHKRRCGVHICRENCGIIVVRTGEGGCKQTHVGGLGLAFQSNLVATSSQTNIDLYTRQTYQVQRNTTMDFRNIPSHFPMYVCERMFVSTKAPFSHFIMHFPMYVCERMFMFPPKPYSLTSYLTFPCTCACVCLFPPKPYSLTSSYFPCTCACVCLFPPKPYSLSVTLSTN